MSIALQQLPLRNCLPIQIVWALHMLSVLINILYDALGELFLYQQISGITSSLFLIVFHEYAEYTFTAPIYMDSSGRVEQSSRLEAVFEGENLCMLFLQPPTQLTK